MTVINESLEAQHRAYLRRYNRRLRERHMKVVTNQRSGRWTPEEDVIVLRDDILLIEKMAMLQRSGTTINARKHFLLRPIGVCRECGSKYPVGRTNKGTCSVRCSINFRITNPRPFIPCAHCGTTFKRHKPERKYCSRACYDAVWASQLRDTVAGRFRGTQPCRHCGMEFRTKKPKPGQRFCSSKCFAAYVSPTYCKRGHEFTPDNTQVDKRGYRQCRACDRIRCAAKRLRKQPGTGAQVQQKEKVS